MKSFIISKNDSDQRLDKFVTKTVPNLPKALMYKYIRTKRIKVNKKKSEISARLRTGDLVEMYINDEFFVKSETKYDFSSASDKIDIIYEDDDLIAVNKGPFLACHPTHNHQGDTLANALAFYLKSKGKQSVFRAVGRLDKGTSGIVICALNKHSAAVIPKTVKKEYYAVVNGRTEKYGTIDKPIYRPDPMKTLRAVGDQGDRAITHWETLSTDGKISLVKIHLETGRTHQIRVHFASIGMPLVGDSMYGTDSQGYGHQLLHCAKVSFVHPVTGERMTLEAPMPTNISTKLEPERE